VSSFEKLIAKADKPVRVCFNTVFSVGKYSLVWVENSELSKKANQSDFDNFCTRASEFCFETMQHVTFIQALNAKKLFYSGLFLLFLACFSVIIAGVAFGFAWIAVIAILIFVFGIGCIYQVINSRARGIYEKLKQFIENNEEELVIKGVEASPGPYGAYIEFSLLQSHKR